MIILFYYYDFEEQLANVQIIAYIVYKQMILIILLQIIRAFPTILDGFLYHYFYLTAHDLKTLSEENGVFSRLFTSKMCFLFCIYLL